MKRRDFLLTSSLLAAGCLLGCKPQTSHSNSLFMHPDRNRAFPVIIHGALGDTRIEQEPKRVITLGVGAEDIAVSLGVLPVAVESQHWGGDERGYLPWFKDAIAQAGWDLPETITMYPELDVEKIVSLRPDLILAPYSGITPAMFKQLSSFVPVVAYPERPWLTPVHEQLEIAGAALGRLPEARRMRQLMLKQIEDWRAAYPQLQKYTFAYLRLGRMSNLSAYVSGDPRVDALTQLGLSLAPSVRDLPVRSGSHSAQVGLENAQMLSDADIVVTWFSSEQERDAAKKVPLYNAIPAVRRGAHIALTDKTLVMAMSYGTHSSLSWGVPRFMPMLLEAISHVTER